LTDPSAPTRVVVLQPGYLPWLGFFDQLRRADVFVYYDDVQYDKHGWRNRNRIKTQNGAQWLTVPVRHGGGDGFPRIMDVGIDNRTPWARKHLASMRQAYARAPFLDRYSSALGIGGERSARLVGICARFGASTYVSGDSAAAYLDVDLFRQQGIEVEWQRYTHPTYAQLHGDFIPYLSAIDLLFNCGDQAPLIAFAAIQ
jgi:hypothetical protein